MLLKFIDLNSPPGFAVNCDNQKAMEKEKYLRKGFEESTKNGDIELKKKKMTTWKPNLKSIDSQNISSFYGKNWKLLVTVIIEIIEEMIVMLKDNNNKDNNKQQYF